VSFFSGSLLGAHVLLGTAPLNSNGKATMSVSDLPSGSTTIYAVYNGDSLFSSSTSALITQVVLPKPPTCKGSYTNWFFGGPDNSVLQGSSGNSFFYAVGGSYQASGSDGDNCFDGGDGNDHYKGGNGHNTVHCGNGNNTVRLGNGDNQIDVGNGSDIVSAGDGNNSTTAGSGSRGQFTFGNGNNGVTLGNGSNNQVLLGSGTDLVALQGGSHDSIQGSGTNSVYLGSGTYNSFSGSAHHSSTCHLPTPPSSWHGTAAAYFHDTLTNCTVVSP
jgi:Ca2+-binding RTX toxin-like protein